MSQERLAFVTAWVILLVSIPVLSSGAPSQELIEDFTTFAYRDAAATTAVWDTLLGEARTFPFRDSLLSTYDTPGGAFNVAVAGAHAFVADFGGGLQIIDISDRSAPVLTGSFNTGGVPISIAVDGDFAYVADAFGLQVVDISNPAAPSLFGSITTPDDAFGVTLAGDWAYVADSDSGLRVIDISNPAAPFEAGSYDTPGKAYRPFVVGDVAYVADETGLEILNVTDPTTPTFLGAYNALSAAIDVFVWGDYAYVADGDSGLRVIDVSDPTTPLLAATVPGVGVLSVDVMSDYAFVTETGGMRVLDITDPTNPGTLASIPLPGDLIGVTVAGEYAYVAAGDSGLHVVDVFDVTVPAELGSLSNPSGVLDAVFSGDVASVLDESGFFRTVDISDPTLPVEIGSLSIGATFYGGLSADGDHVYVATWDNFLAIDISTPSAPVILGSDPTSSGLAIAIGGDYAYTADASNGLRIMDISDPTAPSQVGYYNTPGTAYNVVVAGDLAYVADGDLGIQILDVSDPTLPSLVATYSHTRDPVFYRDIAIDGNFAYLADFAINGFGAGGVIVLDITNPTLPVLLHDPLYGLVACLELSGNYVFPMTPGVADFIQPVEISNPAAPQYFPLGGGFFGVTQSLFVNGDLALIGESDALVVARLFQRESDHSRNAVQSTGIPTGMPARRARLTATGVPTAYLEFSSDFYSSDVESGEWSDAFTSNTLRWRANLFGLARMSAPKITEFKIEWRNFHAAVDSVVDVPSDQGGWAYLYFTRSGFDFTDESSAPATTYDVHRRIDSAPLVAEIRESAMPLQEPVTMKLGEATVRGEPGKGLVVHKDRLYRIVTPAESASSASPPGVWAVVASVTARQEDQYITLVPTVGDSSDATVPYSVYFVSAHTTNPTVFYDSPADSGYSVDNIAPGVPGGMSVAYGGSGNHLSWDPAPEADFQYFRVYRGSSPGFVPGPGNLVKGTASTSWADPDFSEATVFYKLTAVDHAGNESGPASAGAVTPVPDPALPERFALHANAPNPLRSATTISYDLPVETEVSLEIYDVTGRRVRVLVDEVQSAGRTSQFWDGTDDRGKRVSSGIYLYRLRTRGFVETRRMVVLR